MTTIAFLPCRAGSQRVPNKNTRPFADLADGLLGLKLRQLHESKSIDRIVLSTNDPAVIDIGEKWRASNASRLHIDRRPDELCSSTASTDEVIAHVPLIIDDENAVIVWTHVTSPFFEAADYDRALDAYRGGLNAGFDSLMTVTALHAFLWNAGSPINYDRQSEKWPRTQTLDPVYEINSAAFIAPIDVYRTRSDRIGDRPLMFEIDKRKALDIDWPEDFEIAEFIRRISTAT